MAPFARTDHTEVRVRGERVTLDRDGRVRVPEAFRAELGFRPGDPLVVECDGDSLLVRRAEPADATPSND